MDLLTLTSAKTANDAPLTNMPDQEAFAGSMLELEVICARRMRPASILIISIDNLESLAKIYGPSIKDRLIMAVKLEINKIAKSLSIDDSAVYTYHLRHGQFAIILLGRISQKLKLIAEHIRKSISEASFYLFIKGAEGSTSANTLKLTTSIGAVTIEPGTKWMGPASYVEKAALALEYASEFGGNKSVIFDDRGQEYYHVLQ